MQRLNFEYHSMKVELYVSSEDIIKILNVFLEAKQMHSTLLGAIFDKIKDDQQSFSYEIFKELSIIFAAKVEEPSFRDMFFDKFLQKFIKDLPFLDEDTFYMIIWSCVKAGRFQGKKDTFEWNAIREIIKKKANELSPEVLTKLVVLSTEIKEFES